MKKFGLIGYPLGHSFSKKYFDDKFAKENLKDCAFELYPLKEVKDYEILKVAHEDLCGLAVTIPYKETVIPYLSNISADAKVIGAVNCIKFFGNKTMGYNTDVVGFEKSLLPLLQPHHTKALVLGTGGASKAVQYVFKKMGIDFLLVSRNKEDYNNTIIYDEIDAQIMNAYNLIVNCTPLGMSPNEDAMPALPYQYLTSNHLLYDLIYKPEKTKFLQAGEQHGASIKNGFEMLIIQAEENWKIWNMDNID